jgi:hypothetical protein
VLIGGVVDDELGEHANAHAVGLVDEPLEVVQRPVDRVHRRVISNVVPVVAQWRGVKRQQPQAVHAEVAQVRQLEREPREVPDAVVVAVEERAHVRFVDDRVLVPVGVHA